jgi:hypothetical protein
MTGDEVSEHFPSRGSCKRGSALMSFAALGMSTSPVGWAATRTQCTAISAACRPRVWIRVATGGRERPFCPAATLAWGSLARASRRAVDWRITSSAPANENSNWIAYREGVLCDAPRITPLCGCRFEPHGGAAARTKS